MPQESNSNRRHINWWHLCLGLVLNILVIIVALIIYHLTFNAPKNGYTPTFPIANPNLENEMPSE